MLFYKQRKIKMSINKYPKTQNSSINIFSSTLLCFVTSKHCDPVYTECTGTAIGAVCT